ncbi:unnamed protein product [Candida verbasci]|uniref:Uncharacterized protein n=1 Tax=Candida verbasci TaxID=1227364 RepID=A0A9W4XD71_9ASCO|nr:unnamed protein product [Candida verbasci]
MFLIQILLISLVFCLPDQSQSCITNNNIPFTGYKVEYQLNVQKWHGSYHLLYCNDNKLIYDSSLNDSIPWTKPIDYYTSKSFNDSQIVVMSRRKSFALRKLPIYLPNSLIGSLYYGPELKQIHLLNSTNTVKSIPLMAANIFRNWMEVNYKFQFIYHVPILTTPGIDSKRFSHGFFESGKKENDWDQYISIKEAYSYNYDSRILFRKALDNTLLYVDKLTNNNKIVKLKVKNKVEKGSKALFWRLIMLSKIVNQDTFNKILIKLDSFSKYK